jgi:hypothetical protein
MYKNKEFHRKRNSRREELSNSDAIHVSVTPEIAADPLEIGDGELLNYAIISTSEDEGLIVEIDEMHIAASAAVN